MLRHYENECTFHAVECSRCGEAVLHKELATHRAAGCSTSVSSSRAENMSSEARALTLQDVRNALEEVKALLRQPNHDQALPTIQSQMNELKEQVASRHFRLAETTGEAAATAETVKHAVRASSTVLQEPTSQQNCGGEASTSSSALRPPEKISQRLEICRDMLPHILERMRKTTTQYYSQYLVECIWPHESTYHISPTCERLPTRSWRQLRGTVKYIVNIDFSKSKYFREHRIIWNVTVLHTADSYFSIALKEVILSNERTLCADIDFVGMMVGSRCPAPRFGISTYTCSREVACPLKHRKRPCCCVDVGDSVHFHGNFKRTFLDLRLFRYIWEGKPELEITLENS
ncbi:hypothetical protein MRX96_018434 [Rhipicephalus microplus]